MTKRKFTMDRVEEISKDLNNEWLEWNEKLKKMYLDNKIPKEVYQMSNMLRQKYANMITLAANWRFMAEANSIDVPDED